MPVSFFEIMLYIQKVLICFCFYFMLIVIPGVGGATKTHKTSFHAVFNIIKAEGLLGVYNG